MKMAETLESVRKKEDVELDLGLAIGRSFRNRGRPTVMTGESMDLKKKPKKREIPGGTGLDCGSEGEEKNHGQRNKKERPSPVIPMQYSNPPLQYLPMTAINGFVFPCVMPWWGSGPGAGNFDPYRYNVNNGYNEKISDGLPACCSPVVTDNQSCSDEGTVSLFDDGSRSDTRSHESNGSVNKFNNTASSRRPDELSVSGDQKVAESNRIRKKSNNGAFTLASMPCVSTMGEGPESKRIIGFLYRYSKSEVSIVCVCHGKSYSPAEFVKHAGGTEVSNPLKHIKVIPSAFA